MKYRLQVLSGATAVVVLAACLTALSAQQETTFRVDVSLVSVLVTVKDADGTPIGDLEREDFTVTDGGIPRPIAVFERRTDRPISVALMIDASLSTAIELRQERISARRFVENLLREGSHPDDRVAVLKFSAYVDLLAGFTRSIRTLSGALRTVRPESGTALYDAIVVTSEELAGRAGRRVMIIITDGGDTTSSTSFQDALRATQAIDGVIYGIIVMPIKSDAGRNTGGENALKTLARATGGATFVLLGPPEDMNQAFDQILRNLRTQYLLGYYPPELPETNETFRPITVKANRPGVTVLARNGYFLPEARRLSPSIPAERIDIRPKAQGQESLGPVPANGSPKKQP